MQKIVDRKTAKKTISAAQQVSVSLFSRYYIFNSKAKQSDNVESM